MRMKRSPSSQPRDDIHLIFTDVHMPGSMDGLKLAHFVRNRWPPVKIIATSGQARITEGDLPEGGRFHKPQHRRRDYHDIA